MNSPDIEKIYKRNFWALLVEATCFVGAAATMSTTGVVALFINAMTGSTVIVGLAITVQSLFMIAGQLTGAPFTRSIRRLPETLTKIMLAERFIPFFMALPLFLAVDGHWAVGIFLVFFGMFWFFEGSMAVPWAELCARAIKPDLRGYTIGMQVTAGGISSLLVGLLITWLLATPLLDVNYRFGVIFMTGGVLFLASLLGMRLIRDPNPIGVPEKPHIRKFYSQIPKVIRNSKHLQRVLLARLPAFIGFASLPFMLVFGSATLDLSDAQVSWLVYANIIGGLLCGISMGAVSRRFGNKPVIIMCNTGVLISLCMAILLTVYPVLGYTWLFLTCLLSSLSLSCWFGYFTYLIDIAPKVERPYFMVVDACIGIPFSFIGYAMGALINSYGYVPAFLLSAVFAIAAIILSTFLLSKHKIIAMREQSV